MNLIIYVGMYIKAVMFFPRLQNDEPKMGLILYTVCFSRNMLFTRSVTYKIRNCRKISVLMARMIYYIPKNKI